MDAPRMKVSLRGVSGPGRLVNQPVTEAEPISVGRSDRARLAIAGDRFMSSVHFSLSLEGNQVVLRDQRSANGTSVNGVRASEQRLRDGDSIAAGESVFQVSIAGGPGEGRDPAIVLSELAEPLYAVLDTARDPKIYPLLVGSGQPYRSLYDGRLAAQLEAVAPYLVYLPKGSPFLPRLVKEGWSKSWGIYLTCRNPMEEVRKQLRRSLMVTVEETQKNVYFRFYDPRVLRVFLPTADPRQMAEFAGPISSFLMEDKDPARLLRFRGEQGAVRVDRIAVKVAAKEEAGS